MLDKSRIGLLFKSPRASRDVQEAALRKAGAQWIAEVGKVPESWREAVKIVRSGDIVYVYAMSLVPTKRGEDDLTPSAQVSEFILEVHERGGYVVEVHTGRNSKDRAQRRGMTRDAVKTIKRGTRVLPSTGRPRGRPKTEWAPEIVEQARAVWFSRDYATNAIAAKHLPKGMTERHAWDLFKGSGRPFKKRKAR